MAAPRINSSKCVQTFLLQGASKSASEINLEPATLNLNKISVFYMWKVRLYTKFIRSTTNNGKLGVAILKS